MWTVTHTQDEATWLCDVIAHELPPLPSHDQRIAHVETHWHQVAPGTAFVVANPDHGTPDDRRLAEAMVMEQLQPHGFKRATYTLRPDLTKESTWGDIQDKAKRLIQSGNVTILRNGYNSVIGQVQGDHGNYKTEIARQDPNSQAITGSHCPCDWGQFQNLPRTRQWKRFQNRPCAHILATYWQAAATPIDEERAPGDTGLGQMGLPGMGGPMQAPSGMGIMQKSPTPNPNAWFMQPGAPPNAFNQNMPQGGPEQMTAPAPEDVLPQFPMDPSAMPQVNPSSIPGGRPGPTPTDPIQYPGGTFSSYRPARLLHMADQQYQNGQLVRTLQEDQGTMVGRPESGMAGEPVTIPRGAVCEVLGTDPTTAMVNILWMGKSFDQMSYFQPFGATAWYWPSQVTPASDITPPGPAVRRT